MMFVPRRSGFVARILFLLTFLLASATGEVQASEKADKLAPGESPDILKADGPLLEARRLARQGMSLEEVRQVVPVLAVRDNLLEVEIRLKELTPDLVERLRGFGVVILRSHFQYARVDALLDPELLDEVASIPQVSTIHPNYGAHFRVGSVTSQGDASIRADQARSTFFGIDGGGVQVGVLSDSFNDVIGGSLSGSGCNRTLTGSASQVSGDLPSSVVVLDNGPGGGTDEGAGMAEIVHDLAPGADILFRTANRGLADFATGITDLRNCGADVIVDDVIYFAEPMFQDGLIAQAAQAAVDAGVPYFSSAGNEGVGGVRETYADANAGVDDMNFPPSGNDFHNFPGADSFAQVTLPAGCSVRAVLQWNQPFSGTLGPGSAVDLDLYICTAASPASCPFFSAGSQGCSTGARMGDPLEMLVVTNGGISAANIYLAVDHYCGSEANLDFRIVLFPTCTPTFEAGIFDQPQIYGHPAAAGAVAVAAVFYGEIDTGGNVYAPAGTINVEPFSSQGGNLPFYFDGSGNSLPGAPVSRFKPEIGAPDGANTSFFGSDIGYDPDAFPNFFGTSAAAPHAAAVAALVREARSTLSPAGVVGTLRSTAVDIESAGQDVFSGDGLIDALNALNALDALSPIGIELIDFSARQTPEGTLLQWETGYEIDNLGFQVHRQDAAGVHRLTEGPVAGSALLSGTVVSDGHTYSWIDPTPAGSDARYWLEQIDLNGERSFHGPVSATRSAAAGPGPSRHGGSRQLLAEVGRDPHSTVSPRRRAERLDDTRRAPERLLLQRELAADGRALKIRVSEEGIQRLTQPQLVAAGLDPECDPRRLRLFVDGSEVAVSMAGEADGRFDPADTLIFYGFGQDTPWEDSRTYWLIEGAEPGLRWEAETGSNSGPIAESFPESIEWKPRTTYFEGLKNGQEQNFFGPVVSEELVEQTFPVTAWDPRRDGEAFLEIELQGVLGSHRVEVRFNGVTLDHLVFENRDKGAFRVVVPRGILVEGPNRLALLAGEGGEDLSLVDQVSLTYPRRYLVESGQDQLRFTLKAGQRGLLTGFGSQGALVLDVTDPDRTRLADYRVAPSDDASGYSVEIAAGSGDRTLWALRPDRLRESAPPSLNQPSHWAAETAGWEAVVIAARSLLPEISELVDYRRRQGFSVALVAAEDLYDEYSFGAKTPEAIRQFLLEANGGWLEKPRYLTLAGDASFDPRDYLGFGARDLVPTHMGESRFAEAPNDNWFADFNEDGVPEMAVGRLPVGDRRTARVVVGKILDYERTPPLGPWPLNVAIVADQQADFDFPKQGLSLGGLIPEEARLTRVLRDDDAAPRRVETLFNSGQGLIAYLGHGSVERWAGGLLTTQSAKKLRNGGQLPLVLSMSCLTGRFHGESDSLAETLLLNAGGGAVAVLASPTLEGAEDQRAFSEALFRALLDSDARTLGDAIERARAFPGVPPASSLFQLFGDPLTRPVFAGWRTQPSHGWRVHE